MQLDNITAIVMPKCAFCGKEVPFPFQCNYCDEHFCPEHRLPERHSCNNIPTRPPIDSRSVTKKITSYIKHQETPMMTKKKLVNKKSLNNLKSLKIWFPVFWLIVVILFFMGRDNSVQFYRSVSEPMKYGLYIFASVIGLWFGYKIFQKCDYSPSSDRGIFGLRLLSVGIFIGAIFVLFVGISLVYESFFPFGNFFMEPQINLAKETTAIFFIVLSLVLIILSAYLIFKFERRSGVIVYRR